MGIQLSIEARNAILDAIEAVFGPSAVLMVRSGPVPVNCAAIDAGTVGVSITLPTDAMLDAAGGSKSKTGVWSSVGIANITAGHFRLYKGDGVTCVMQGTISESGGGGEMIIDSTTILIGKPTTVAQFDLTGGNA